MFATIITYAQKRIAARRQYLRTIAEIESMSDRDLVELGAFQCDLYRAAREEYLAG